MSITNDFFTSLNDPKAAMWSAGVAFNRSNPLPLDKWSVFQTKALAEEYASTNAVAYPGQVIAVHNETDGIMEVYVLSEIILEDNSTILGLQEMAGKIEVDNNSINFNEETGLLEISGFKGAAHATLPQKKVADDGTVTLEWVSIDAIVEGDGNTTYTVALNTDKNGFILTPSEGEATTITLDVYTKSEVDAIAQVLQKAIADEEARAIAVEQATAAAVALKANSADVYTKQEVDTKVSTEISSALESAGHLTRKIVETLPDPATADEDVIYMIISGTGTALTKDYYIEYMVINGAWEVIGNTYVDLTDYVTNDSLTITVNELETKINKKAEQSALEELNNTVGSNKDEVDGALVEIRNQLALKAVKTEVEEALSRKADQTVVETELAKKVDNTTYEQLVEIVNGKADKATTLEGYGITDAYTKGETYTREEISDLIADITGGESAADVLADLNAYKGSNDERVGKVETKLNTIAEGAQVNVIEAVKIEGQDEALEITEKTVTLPAATVEQLGLVKLSAEVGIDENNALEVKSLNVNKLAQTEGDVLILNGGAAKV